MTAEASTVLQRIAALDKTKVSKSSKGYNYTYADLSEVTSALSTLLEGSGITYVQIPSSTADEVTVTTVVMCKGDSYSVSMSLPYAGASNPAQALGSCVTYLRRYSLVALFGLLPSDDDGSAVAAKPAAKQTGGEDLW